MNPRIQAAQLPYSQEINLLLSKTMPPGIAPLTLFTTLARDERLFKKFFAGGLLDRGHLTLRHRELVIDRTTALNGCEYEWGVHIEFFADRVNLTPEQITSLVRGNAQDDCWDTTDRTLIRLCDELHQTSNVSEELWTLLQVEFSEEALLELLMLAGFYRTVSYLCNSLRLPLEEYGRRFPV
jgi:alkylhydroperoxidase family enzyme